MGHTKDFFKDLSLLQKVVFSTLFFVALLANLEYIITSQATLFVELDEAVNEIIVEVNGQPNVLKRKHFFQTSSRTAKGFYIDLKSNDSVRIILSSPDKAIIRNVYLLENSLLKTQAHHINHDKEKEATEIGESSNGWSLSYLHGQYKLDEIKKTIEFAKYHHIHLFFFLFLILLTFSVKGWIEFYKTSDPLLIILFTTQAILFFCFVNDTTISDYETQLYGSAVWYKLHWLPPSLQWTNYYVPRDSVSNLAFGVPSDFVLLVSAKTSYLLDQVYFLPRFARNFRIAQHILIFLSFGLIYRFASQAVARYTLILFTVISPIFISFMAFNDIVLSSIFLLTAYSALISSSKDSPHFPIIAFSALFMTFNTSFSPLFTAPAFLFLIYQKFVDYRSRDFLRLAALLGFSLPIVLYRSIFNTYDELFSGQRYQQVIANRMEEGVLGIALENYQTLSLIALVVIFITLFSASSQEKWFKFYFWLFPINILSILIHFL